MTNKPTIWFTADLHLGHTNVIKYTNRPFINIEEMDETLINNINRRVKLDDTLYIVGDFAGWSVEPKEFERYRRAIQCKNLHLIIGNHDRPVLAHLNPLFTSIHDLLDLMINGQRITLCHYAMKTWHQSHRGAWSLYGHSHHGLEDDSSLLSIDIGVDGKGYNYSPLSLADIRAKMNEKKWISPFIKWEKEGKLYRPDAATKPEHPNDGIIPVEFEEV